MPTSLAVSAALFDAIDECAIGLIERQRRWTGHPQAVIHRQHALGIFNHGVDHLSLLFSGTVPFSVIVPFLARSRCSAPGCSSVIAFELPAHNAREDGSASVSIVEVLPV
jgi:hypothetical protein